MNDRFPKTLRVRLIVWYVGSIAFFTLFFYIVVHLLSLPHSTHLYIILFSVFTILGVFFIFRVTKSLTYLSSRIRHISRKNLYERILDMNSEDEIGELARSFNSLLDHLNEAFIREQQFIGDVAHELKTPMATQISSFEVTLSKPRNKEEYIKTIENALVESHQLSSTLNNVLDLAWSESTNKQNKETKFNLSILLDELYEIAQKIALKKRIDVKLSASENVFVFGFKDKLARALLNIIDNAIKYSPNDGQIELILEKTPSKILISVSDEGPGISKEEIPYIFNRFYRGTKTDKVVGSGLGLAIAKSIIILLKGEIIVKSSPGKGSTFVIVLPLSSI